MTSQPQQQTIMEPQLCDDHGMMVPVNADFVLLDDNDKPVAITTWFDDPDGVTPEIWAVTEQVKASIPEPNDNLGEWIYRMQQRGRLIEYTVYGQQGVFRIDDNRKGCDHSYRIRIANGDETGLVLQTGVIYYCYEQKKTQSTQPRLETFEQVVELMHDAGVLVIADLDGLDVSTELDDPEVAKRWDLKNRVVVWDEGSICMNQQASQVS